MADTIAVSPINGVVLVKAADVGEILAPGTSVVTVGDIDHPWLRAYIREQDLGRVKLGDKVRVTTDSFPGKVYDGHVSFISSAVSYTHLDVYKRQLLGRLQAEGDLLPRMITSQFGDVLQRFGSALRAALPDLPKEELFWRLNLALGALAQTLRGGSKNLEIIPDLSLSFNSETALERLVAFLSAGFRAPVPTHAIQGSHVAVQER